MVKEIIFHLGDCKTGSTSIQSAIRAARWSGGKSLFYPASDTRLHHGFLARTLSQPALAGKRAQKFTKMAARLDSSDADLGIISSEHFEFVDPAKLKTALINNFPEKLDNIRLIAYVRPHVDRLISSYSERVKLGYQDGSLADYCHHAIARKRFFYAPRFNRWRQVFGDRFELRPLIRSQLLQQSVVPDFLGFAFGSTAFELPKEPSSNESLGLEDLMVLREIYRHIKAERRAEPIGRNFARILSEFPQAKKTKVYGDKVLIEEVISKYQKDADTLDKEFFTGTPMRTALLSARDKALDQPQSTDATDHFTEAELRGVRAWSALVGKMYALDPDEWSGHFVARRLASLG